MKQFKVTLLTSIGSALEYYDLVIYSLLAEFISRKYLANQDHTLDLFIVFGILIASNLARPLGGIVFGLIGDTSGRKKVFSTSLIWMAVATLGIGIIPAYQHIGIWSVILLGLCRFMQNLFYGAEFPGALTILSENTAQKRIGFHFGLLISATGLGVSLGSLIIYLLTKLLSTDQLHAWGFRIPFLLGASTALVGFHVRKHLPEKYKAQLSEPNNCHTTAFLTKTKKIAKNHYLTIIGLIGISLFSACFANFKLVLPTYLYGFYSFSLTDVYFLTSLGYVCSIFMKIAFGWLVDKITAVKLITITTFLMIVLTIPAFMLLSTKNYWALFTFIMFSQLVTSSIVAGLFVLLPQVFPTSVRYTGVGLSYNISQLLAAFVPWLANYCYGVIYQPLYLAYFMIGLAVIAIISIKLLNPNKLVASNYIKEL